MHSTHRITRAGLLLLLVMTLWPGLLAFSPPPQQDITLDVTPGYGADHYFRSGEWTPLRVTVSGAERTIRGFLQIRAASHPALTTTEQRHTIYRTPVAIDPRAGDVTLFLYAVLPSFTREVTVELVETDGRIVQEGRSRVTEIALRDVLYTVVTESLTDTIDLTAQSIGRGASLQASLSIDDIPPNANALRAIDVMVFFDVDTGNLSIEQRQALADWVQTGGHLVVHGGPNWQRTTAGLGDLLPVTPENTVSVEDARPLGDYLSRPDPALEASALLTRSEPQTEAEVLLAIENIPTIVRRAYGGGQVDFIALDPLTEPFAAYESLPRLWFELITNVGPRPSWQDGFVNWSSADRAVRVAAGVTFPSVLQLLAFLGVYVLLVGPLNYMVLRLVGRRELAWITIPLLIAGFTAVAYFAGFNLRGTRPAINQLNVVQVWQDSDRARVDSLVGVFSPRRTTYNVEAAGDFSLRPLPRPASNDFLLGDRQVAVTQGQTERVTDIPVDAGIIMPFSASGYTARPVDYEGNLTWTPHPTAQRASISGSYQSDIALDDVVLLVKDGAVPLGRIEAGQTRHFDFDVTLQEPAWLTLGNNTAYDERFQFNGRQGRSLSFVFYNDRSQVQCNRPLEVDTIAQIMQSVLHRCLSDTGFDDHALQSRMLMLQALIKDLDFSGGRGLDAYLVGWSDTSPFAIDLPGHASEVAHQTLYILHLPGQVEPPAGEEVLHIAPGLMTWTAAGRNAPNTRTDISPYDIAFSASGRTVLRFVPLGNLQQAQATRLDVTFRATGSLASLQLALWNWDTQTWDEQDIPGGIVISLSGPEAAQYIGPSNAVEVQITKTNDVDFAAINALEVTLYAQTDAAGEP